jgi:succinate-semialdehyde dehydrogenase/glutarate-semialdehyde dehydrogenase
VVHGDGQVGAALTQAGPDFIFLTGSTGTGRKAMHAAAESLTPIALELSGKDAMIVLEDADLEAAARWGVWGAFFNAGQTCMAVERVYVLESKFDEFVQLAVKHAKEFKTGYTTESDNSFSMGPVIDPRQVGIIDRHLEDALAKGARVLTGGKEKGMFFDPMVLVDVDHSMLLMREETFGPLLPIMKVKDEDEAVRLANDSTFGLGASVWSRDQKHAKRVSDQVQAASVIVNDCIAQFGIPMLPFGGVKGSGFGRIHGREGLLQFTRPYSYAVGAPPVKWDIATILRENGHYELAIAIMGVLYGTSLRQRWETLSQFIWKKNGKN